MKILQTERRNKVTDTLAFRAYLVKRGYTVQRLAAELGIAPCSLSYKINNKREFKPSEIVAIKRILRMTSEERDAIFFAD